MSTTARKRRRGEPGEVRRKGAGRRAQGEARCTAVLEEDAERDEGEHVEQDVLGQRAAVQLEHLPRAQRADRRRQQEGQHAAADDRGQPELQRRVGLALRGGGGCLAARAHAVRLVHADRVDHDLRRRRADRQEAGAGDVLRHVPAHAERLERHDHVVVADDRQPDERRRERRDLDQRVGQQPAALLRHRAASLAWQAAPRRSRGAGERLLAVSRVRGRWRWADGGRCRCSCRCCGLGCPSGARPCVHAHSGAAFRAGRPQPRAA